MAGVALLQPQAVLKHDVSYRQRMRSGRNSTSNPLPNPNPKPKNNRRKRSPQKNGSANFSTCPSRAKNLSPVMGEVKILKRGQVLKDNKLVTEDLVLFTTDRRCPEPDMVTIADFYAGSGFSSSPPPSSLPVPAFFKKKSENNLDPTSDLRRLLRLDLS